MALVDYHQHLASPAAADLLTLLYGSDAAGTQPAAPGSLGRVPSAGRLVLRRFLEWDLGDCCAPIPWIQRRVIEAPVFDYAP